MNLFRSAVRLTVVGALFGLGACATSGSTGPVAQVKYGAKYQKAVPTKILLMPPLCVSSDESCEDRFVTNMVAKITQAFTERGATLVEARAMLEDARIRADAKPAMKALAEKLGPAVPSSPSKPSPYEAISTTEQALLLKESGANATLAARLVIGPRTGISPARDNTVTIRLSQGENADLLWSSDCMAPSALVPPLSQAVENATECSLNGVFHPSSQSNPSGSSKSKIPSR